MTAAPESGASATSGAVSPTPAAPGSGDAWPARPGRSGSGLRRAAMVLIVLGAVLGVVPTCVSVAGALHRPGPAHQVPAADGGDVTLDHPGDYAIYYRNGDRDSGRAREPTAASTSLSRVPSAQVIGPGFTDVTVNSDPPEQRGHPPAAAHEHRVGRFHAATPGRYHIETGGFEVPSGTFTVMALSRTPTVHALPSVIASLVVVGIGLGLVMLDRHRNLVRTHTSSPDRAQP